MLFGSKGVMLVDIILMVWECVWNVDYNYIFGNGWCEFVFVYCFEEYDVLVFFIFFEIDIMGII